MFNDHPSKYDIGITAFNGRLLVSIYPKEPSDPACQENPVVHFIKPKDEPQLMEALRRSASMKDVVETLQGIAIDVEMSRLERDIIEYWRQHPAKR